MAHRPEIDLDSAFPDPKNPVKSDYVIVVTDLSKGAKAFQPGAQYQVTGTAL